MLASFFIKRISAGFVHPFGFHLSCGNGRCGALGPGTRVRSMEADCMEELLSRFSIFFSTDQNRGTK